MGRVATATIGILLLAPLLFASESRFWKNLCVTELSQSEQIIASLPGYRIVDVLEKRFVYNPSKSDYQSMEAMVDRLKTQLSSFPVSIRHETKEFDGDPERKLGLNALVLDPFFDAWEDVFLQRKGRRTEVIVYPSLRIRHGQRRYRLTKWLRLYPETMAPDVLEWFLRDFYWGLHEEAFHAGITLSRPALEPMFLWTNDFMESLEGETTSDLKARIVKFEGSNGNVFHETCYLEYLLLVAPTARFRSAGELQDFVDSHKITRRSAMRYFRDHAEFLEQLSDLYREYVVALNVDVDKK